MTKSLFTPASAPVQTTFCVPEYISWNDIEGELTLFNRNDGSYHGLNLTASYIWRGISHGMDEHQIVSDLQSRFEQNEATIRDAVDIFLTQACESGLLTQPPGIQS